LCVKTQNSRIFGRRILISKRTFFEAYFVMFIPNVCMPVTVFLDGACREMKKIGTMSNLPENAVNIRGR